MQPRQSDSQQCYSLLVLGAFDSSGSTCSLHSRADFGGSTRGVDEPGVGAVSHVACVESIARERAAQTRSAGTAGREDSGGQGVERWWRIDGKHDSLEDPAVLSSQGKPANGMFNKNLAAELRDLLSTQVDVGPTFTGLDAHGVVTNAAVEIQANRTTDVSERRQQADLSDVLPKIVCGLHDSVSQQVLRSLGFDASVSGRSESWIENENALKKDKVAAVLVRPLKFEIGSELLVSDVRSEFLDRSDVLYQTEFLHQSERVTCGPVVFSTLGGDGVKSVQANDVRCRGGGASDVLVTDQLVSICKEVGRGDVLDVSGFLSAQRNRSCTTNHSAFNGFDLVAGPSGGLPKLGNDRSGECVALISDVLQEGGLVATFGTTELAKSPIDGTSVVSEDKLWHEHWAWHSSRESVRWFVGNLLLRDSATKWNDAASVIPAVSELFAIGLHSGATEVQAICGAWSTRLRPDHLVDIHRVVLQLGRNGSHGGHSWAITAFSESGSLGAALVYSHATSASVSTPRAWSRVSEFRLLVGSGDLNGAIQFGSNVSFASAHGTAFHLGRCVEDYVVDVVDFLAITPARNDCRKQCWDLTSGDNRVLGYAIAMHATPVKLRPANECSRWDASSCEADVVRCSKITKNISQVDLACVSESVSGLAHKVVGDELLHRIQTGPVLRDGVDNFQSMNSGACVSLGLRLGLEEDSVLRAVTLDHRFLRSWPSSKRFNRTPNQLVLGREEGTGRIKPIDVGVMDSGVSDASVGQVICGTEAMSDQKSIKRLYRPTMVIRQRECTAGIQAASRFGFLCHAQGGWLTEQFDKVVLHSDSAFINQHLVSCGHDVEIDPAVSIFGTAEACETNVCNISTKWFDRLNSREQCTFQAFVMCVGFTHAYTLAHVPQYLNRAAWCRHIKPQVLESLSSVNVAEHFFPPLVTFEVPRLVLPVLFEENTNGVACAAIMVGHVRRLPRAFWAEEESPTQGRETLCSNQVALLQIPESGESMILSEGACPTSTTISPLRVVESLRNFTNPLSHDLRRNWSLIEVLCGPKERAGTVTAGCTCFLVMSEKRSLEYLSHHWTAEHATETLVEPEPVACMTPVVEALKNSRSESRLTDQWTHQDMMVGFGNDKMSVGASLDLGSVWNSADILDVEACCSGRLRLLTKTTMLGAQYNAKALSGTEFVWIPESRNPLVDVNAFRLRGEMVEATAAGENVEVSSSPISSQFDAKSLPVILNRPMGFDEAVARKLEDSSVNCPSEIHMSVNLGVDCTNQRYTNSLLNRAA